MPSDVYKKYYFLMETKKGEQNNYYIKFKINQNIYFMKHFRTFFALIFLTIIFSTMESRAQSKKNSFLIVKYQEGVYFNSFAFINQTPSLLKNQLIIGSIVANSIRSWSKSDSLFFKESDGVKKSKAKDNIWGFYENGDLYITHNGSPYKVNTIGMISLFNETFTMIKAPNAPVALDQTKESKLYFSDLSNGQIYEYSVESLKQFLKFKDETIYNQFMSYKSNKKRREMMYHCIELYNDTHPLFS